MFRPGHEIKKKSKTKHFKGHEIYNNTSFHKMRADCEGPVFDVIFGHLFGHHFEGLFCDAHHANTRFFEVAGLLYFGNITVW